MKLKMILILVFSLLLIGCAEDNYDTKGISNLSEIDDVEVSDVSERDVSESKETVPERAKEILEDLKTKLPNSSFEIKYKESFSNGETTYYDFYEYYNGILIDQCIRYSNPAMLHDHEDGYVFGEIIIDISETEKDIRCTTDGIAEKYIADKGCKGINYNDTIYLLKDGKCRLAYHFTLEENPFEHIYISPITNEVLGTSSDIIID